MLIYLFTKPLQGSKFNMFRRVIMGWYNHRWELPVLRYHRIRGNYHSPFLVVNFSVVLHNFIRKNYHKNLSDRYHHFLIMVNYPIFLINSHILHFQMYYQLVFSSQSTRTMYRKKIEILQFLE